MSEPGWHIRELPLRFVGSEAKAKALPMKPSGNPVLVACVSAFPRTEGPFTLRLLEVDKGKANAGFDGSAERGVDVPLGHIKGEVKRYADADFLTSILFDSEDNKWVAPRCKLKAISDVPAGEKIVQHFELLLKYPMYQGSKKYRMLYCPGFAVPECALEGDADRRLEIAIVIEQNGKVVHLAKFRNWDVAERTRVACQDAKTGKRITDTVVMITDFNPETYYAQPASKWGKKKVTLAFARKGKLYQDPNTKSYAANEKGILEVIVGMTHPSLGRSFWRAVPKSAKKLHAGFPARDEHWIAVLPYDYQLWREAKLDPNGQQADIRWLSQNGYFSSVQATTESEWTTDPVVKMKTLPSHAKLRKTLRVQHMNVQKLEKRGNEIISAIALTNHAEKYIINSQVSCAKEISTPAERARKEFFSLVPDEKLRSKVAALECDLVTVNLMGFAQKDLSLLKKNAVKRLASEGKKAARAVARAIADHEQAMAVDEWRRAAGEQWAERVLAKQMNWGTMIMESHDPDYCRGRIRDASTKSSQVAALAQLSIVGMYLPLFDWHSKSKVTKEILGEGKGVISRVAGRLEAEGKIRNRAAFERKLTDAMKPSRLEKTLEKNIAKLDRKVEQVERRGRIERALRDAEREGKALKAERKRLAPKRRAALKAAITDHATSKYYGARHVGPLLEIILAAACIYGYWEDWDSEENTTGLTEKAVTVTGVGLAPALDAMLEWGVGDLLSRKGIVSAANVANLQFGATLATALFVAVDAHIKYWRGFRILGEWEDSALAEKSAVEIASQCIYTGTATYYALGLVGARFFSLPMPAMWVIGGLLLTTGVIAYCFEPDQAKSKGFYQVEGILGEVGGGWMGRILRAAKSGGRDPLSQIVDTYDNTKNTAVDEVSFKRFLDASLALLPEAARDKFTKLAQRRYLQGKKRWQAADLFFLENALILTDRPPPPKKEPHWKTGGVL